LSQNPAHQNAGFFYADLPRADALRTGFGRASDAPRSRQPACRKALCGNPLAKTGFVSHNRDEFETADSGDNAPRQRATARFTESAWR
jgi:hypothetical protein